MDYHQRQQVGRQAAPETHRWICLWHCKCPVCAYLAGKGQIDRQGAALECPHGTVVLGLLVCVPGVSLLYMDKLINGFCLSAIAHHIDTDERDQQRRGYHRRAKYNTSVLSILCQFKYPLLRRCDAAQSLAANSSHESLVAMAIPVVLLQLRQHSLHSSLRG